MRQRRGVSAVVLDGDRQRVLLHKREDFRIWALPAGRVERDETPEAAAVRETREETGYDVVLDRLVGEYVRPQFGAETMYVYAAHVVGGAPIERGPETVAVGWFSLTDLPGLLPFPREYVRDAVAAGAAPLKQVQRLPWTQALLIRIAVRLRDLRNWLTRRSPS